MGFIKNEIYVLTIHENAVVSPKRVPYGSVEAFLKNWLPVAERGEIIEETAARLLKEPIMTINEVREKES